MQQILPSPCQQGGGGGYAAPADSGADASVRLAGRTARTRLWSREVYIISSLVCKKHIRKVKPCMTIESGPEWIVTLFFAEYGLALIQCAMKGSREHCNLNPLDSYCITPFIRQRPEGAHYLIPCITPPPQKKIRS